MKNQPAYVSEFYGNICRLMVYSRETNQSLYLYKTIPVILAHHKLSNCHINLSDFSSAALSSIAVATATPHSSALHMRKSSYVNIADT